MKGLFITLEGGEGSGKSTAINAISEYYTKKGRKVVLTREPGGIKIAEDIRNIILDVNNTKMTKETETLLYAAARMQHLSEKVIPALERGEVVVCDRYIDSSFVYQGIARGVGLEAVKNANVFALDHMPDVTFFLDVKPEVGLKRIVGRAKMDRLDLESLDFHNKVYNGYLKICDIYKDRIVRINGEQSPEDVIKDILEVLERL